MSVGIMIQLLDIGVSLAQYLSTKNKLISGVDDLEYKGDDNEWLVHDLGILFIFLD